jgi:hypothetical protein
MKTKSSNRPVNRKLPQRTCVACRRIGEKRDLVRLVRTADNQLEIDETGKKSGRGAYLCRTGKCWEIGINGGKLEHSLHINLLPEYRELILKQGQGLIQESTIG